MGTRVDNPPHPPLIRPSSAPIRPRAARLVPGARLGFNRGMSSSYRFAGPFVLRLLGAGLALLGVVVVALVVLAALLPLPGATVGTVLVVAAAGVVLLGLARRIPVVHLDEAGYRVRLIRGAGVRRAQWRAVEDVVAATVAGSRCVVLRLRDGRTTTVPVGVLEGRAEDFVLDLQRHLNDGHGYRPVPRRG